MPLFKSLLYKNLDIDTYTEQTKNSASYSSLNSASHLSRDMDADINTHMEIISGTETEEYINYGNNASKIADKDSKIHLGKILTNNSTEINTVSVKQFKDKQLNQFNINEYIAHLPEQKIICIFIVWLSGVLLLLLYTITINVFLWLNVRKGNAVNDSCILEVLDICEKEMNINCNIKPVYVNNLRIPALYGIINPRILFPYAFSSNIVQDDIRHIILHELSHFKRKDIAVNWIICALQIIHWWNPLIWYAFKRMRQDAEIACDAMVLSVVGSDKKTNYGHTILKLLGNCKNDIHAAGMASVLERKKQIKRRITMISLFKKGSYKWTLPAIVILLVIAFISLTNPKGFWEKNNDAINRLSGTQAPFNNTQANTPENKTLPVIYAGTIDTAMLTSEEPLDVGIPDSISIYDIDFDKFSGPGGSSLFKGKMMVISDPTKIEVGFAENFENGAREKTSEIAKRNNAVAAINAAGFVNPADEYAIKMPEGLIIHEGRVIHKYYQDRWHRPDMPDTFMNIIGFNNEGKLIVGTYSMSKIEELGIKEAVSCGPPIIIDGKPMINSDGGWGYAPRTAIGQKEDGSVIFLIIDGRSLESIGASLKDLQDIFLKCGAVNAANLDGGASSTMYCNGEVINNPSNANRINGDTDIIDKSEFEAKVSSAFIAKQ